MVKLNQVRKIAKPGELLKLKGFNGGLRTAYTMPGKVTITLRRRTNDISKSVIEIIILVEAQEKVETRCHPVWNELMMTAFLHPVDHRTQGDQRPGKARRPEGP